MPISPVARGQRPALGATFAPACRDGRLLRPHQAGRPEVGDHVYVITTPEYVGLLDRLFASGADHADDPRLFGEFGIDREARLSELAVRLWFCPQCR